MSNSLITEAENYNHGVIGNGRSAALIEPDGSIVFACLPDFDSGTVFAAMLDSEKGGSFGIEMIDGKAVSQEYERHTNILITRFEGKSGAFRVIDFMPRYTWDGKAGSEGDASSDIVRVLEPLKGTPEIRVHYDPKLEYARFPTENNIEPGRIKSQTSGTRDDGRSFYESLYLYSDVDAEDILEQRPVTLDKTTFFLVSYHDKVQEPDGDTVNLMLQRTRSYWLLWCARTHRPAKYGEQVLRSALTLRMLQFDLTGAVVAAVTTSLPESIGETRNWDYRFCWIRDASMTVSILRKIGHPGMASRFIDWILRTVTTKDDKLQIMYGLRGEKHLTEETLDHLSGYKNSAPVRIGNAAHDQEQHDIYGVLLDVIYQDLSERVRTPESLDRLWTRVRAVARSVADRWREPDRGIWEIRGETRQFVFSKVLCWVAIDRAIRIACLLDKNDWAEQHVALLEDIYVDICDHGWNEEIGAFTQSYGSTELDSSNLLMAEYGFIEVDDPRFVSTVDLTLKELCRDGLMYRYKNHDDFGEPSSAFTVCSFWMVKALAVIGRRNEARAMFDTLLAAANPHGLYGEDLDFSSRRQLGNFPQAYSHLALIDCALELEKEDDEHLIEA
ncbi:MAG: GH15 family glucan-1,4-alpha-glucosidase [Verrucomicrobiales bacterium]|jgi:GH15 family glucan-1,4-alpha-glucosidase